MFDKQAVVSPAKPPQRPDPEVNWDATVFRVFNPDFPLYIKHEDLSEIVHGGQCLSISIIQLWILPDNYLKGIINSALKGLNDTPQPKSKAATRWIVIKCNRQKGNIECDYYIMHWMSTIILGTFRNWEAIIGAREMKGASHPVGTILSPT
ncbi:hypothetical protein GmHk_14G041190 [Glycine max]|nr:hypothetical protein GmHk_14G041190 [Glycine max]